jgi:hypothetical protein
LCCNSPPESLSFSIVVSRYQAENMRETSGNISVQPDPDGTATPPGPRLRWAPGAGVADTATQQSIEAPAGTTVDQNQFFTTQPSNNTAEFATYVDGTAAANKVGTWHRKLKDCQFFHR